MAVDEIVKCREDLMPEADANRKMNTTERQVTECIYEYCIYEYIKNEVNNKINMNNKYEK